MEYYKEKRLLEKHKPLLISMMETKCPTTRTPQQWQQAQAFVEIFEHFETNIWGQWGEISNIIHCYPSHPVFAWRPTECDCCWSYAWGSSWHGTGTPKGSEKLDQTSTVHVLAMLLDPRFKDSLLSPEQLKRGKESVASYGDIKRQEPPQPQESHHAASA